MEKNKKNKWEIKSATLVPKSELEIKSATLVPKSELEICTHCTQGGRSAGFAYIWDHFLQIYTFLFIQHLLNKTLRGVGKECKRKKEMTQPTDRLA